VKSPTLFIVLIVLFAARTVAQAAEGPFDKGTKNFSLYGSYVTPIRYSDDRLYNLNVSGGYYFWNNNSINLELQGSYVDQPGGGDDDAVLGAVGILGRWHFLVRDQWSLFIDGGGGVSYADHMIPIFGTNFNFIGKVGIGASWEIQDRTYLMGGMRYYHFSNGQIHGRDDNPSYDGLQFWAGVMWTW
jgi:hypothetical protein